MPPSIPQPIDLGNGYVIVPISLANQFATQIAAMIYPRMTPQASSAMTPGVTGIPAAVTPGMPALASVTTTGIPQPQQAIQQVQVQPPPAHSSIAALSNIQPPSKY